MVPTARQNIVGFLKFSTTSSCGCKKLEEIPKKIKFPQSNPPKKNLFYFVIFEVLRNIIKIYYFFLFHFIRGNGTCCPCPTCCFPSFPRPVRGSSFFALAKQARTASSGCVDDTVRNSFVGRRRGLQFCNRETQVFKKETFLFGHFEVSGSSRVANCESFGFL